MLSYVRLVNRAYSSFVLSNFFYFFKYSNIKARHSSTVEGLSKGCVGNKKALNELIGKQLKHIVDSVREDVNGQNANVDSRSSVSRQEPREFAVETGLCGMQIK